jgi:S-adenosylmethionine:tRNA ribosyltransferase-isomerase
MCEVISKTTDGHYCVTFHGSKRVDEQLEDIGEIPLPPYIQRTGKPSKEDQERYQTVYADKNGSVAAPTAGLHYTPELLETLRKHGVQLSWVTLHVGLGTFNPIKTEWATDHRMHEERYEISEDTMRAIQAAKKAGRRVIAVGTTSLRVLESVASIWSTDQPARPIKQKTDIFIYPPYRFGLTDGLITNFHLPQSSLMMLVSAFSSPGSLEGIQILKDLYAEAVKERYRFFSFGDAMMIL